jgi:AraC-like DNA-binding protein
MQKAPQKLRSIHYGEECLSAGYDLPRHQHFEAYATVVLDGSFEQVGYAGRCVVGPGDILIQPTLDSHGSRMLSAGIRLLRLPWSRDSTFGGVFRGLDVDRIRQIAVRDIDEAAHCMAQQMIGARSAGNIVSDWEDIVVQRIRAQPDVSVQSLAEEMHLSREALSRGFRRSYGASPVSFRTEMRTREAWLRITGTRDALSTIATDIGFADQSHMTRAIRALTHATPSSWRHRIKAAESQGEPAP